MANLVYDPVTKKMIPAEKAKGEKGDYTRISFDGKLFQTLRGYAAEDRIDFTGQDGEESKAKVSNAVRKYVEIAVGEFITAREARGEQS